MLPRNVRRRSHSRQRRKSETFLRLPQFDWRRWDKLVAFVLFTCSTHVLPEDGTASENVQAELLQIGCTCLGIWTIYEIVKAFHNDATTRDAMNTNNDAYTQTDTSNEKYMIDARIKERAFQREIRRLRRQLLNMKKQCAKKNGEHNYKLACATRNLCSTERTFVPLKQEVTCIDNLYERLREDLFLEQEKHKDIIRRFGDLETQVIRDKSPCMTKDIEDELNTTQFEAGDGQMHFNSIRTRPEIDDEFCTTQ